MVLQAVTPVCRVWPSQLLVLIGPSSYIQHKYKLEKRFEEMGALTVAVVVLASLEVGYFVKTFVWVVGSRLFRARIHPLQSSTTYGLCTTRDIDFLLTHMNNSRYLRTMDFARVEHFVRSRLTSSVHRLKGSAVVASTVIRYRKPVYLFSPYAVDTGIVYWDDKSIYYRQDVRTLHDNFIRATAYLKVTLLGCKPAQCLQIAVNAHTTRLAPHAQDSQQSLTALEAIARGISSSSNSGIASGSSGTNYVSKRQLQEAQVSDLLVGDDLHFLHISGDDIETYFEDKQLPVDLSSFIKYNELSSIRMRAGKLVNSATKEAVNRVAVSTKEACNGREKAE